MKKTIQMVSALLLLTLSGCGTVPTTTGSQPQSQNAITFFKNLTTKQTSLSLHPDRAVEKAMPNQKPPKRPVTVNLPVYPGAVQTKSDNLTAKIGDLGTPMNVDLMDGTVYYRSKDSQALITAWYKAQLQKLGYSIGGHGTTGRYGSTTSAYYQFSKNTKSGKQSKIGSGTTKEYPDIDLGFLSQKHNGETIFKLKVLFIEVPPRPKDSYLPTDIVKVVLTKGKQTKTITNRKWIKSVVNLINELQVETPGISSGGSMAINGNTVTVIDGKFYRTNGSAIHVKYAILFRNVKVGNSNVALNSGPYPALGKDFQSAFKH